MPKIYEYFGLIFLIFTDDHTPIHIHVKRGNRESVLEIFVSNGKVTTVKPRKLGKSSASQKQLTDKQLNTALKFVNVKAEEIVEAWKLIKKGEFHQKPIKITRKIV